MMQDCRGTYPAQCAGRRDAPPSHIGVHLEHEVLKADMSDLADAIAIVTAVGCGIILGLERESRRRAAGLRTLTLISLGACLLTQAGIWLALSIGDHPGVQSDPTRLASYVIAGIGFLGAGPIVARRGSVKGLTTAADIWIAATIGILCGIGRPLVAGAATALVVVVLLGLQPFNERLAGGIRGPFRLVLRIRNPLSFRRFEHLLENSGIVQERTSVVTDAEWLVTMTYAGTSERCGDFLADIAALGPDIAVLSAGDRGSRLIGDEPRASSPFNVQQSRE